MGIPRIGPSDDGTDTNVRLEDKSPTEGTQSSSSASIASGSTASAYTFDYYQEDASLTAIYPDHGKSTPEAINYTVLGLIGEAGEIANKWKKFYRDGQDLHPGSDVYEARFTAYRSDIAAEVGDVLWYCANLATELGISFGEIAAANYAKLADRKSRNVLRGSGDNR